ncbi:MAG: hypothetical protein SCH70_11355, partial [Candidatus Methanoperedens sp.]|nr:hypothetical protein [Candidatus Methanoperedens sp.]
EYKVITCGKFNLVGFIPWVICPRCKTYYTDVGSGVNWLEVDLNWGNKANSLSLTIYKPGGSSIGTYYDSSDGVIDGRIHIDIVPGQGYVEAGQWKYEAYGVSVVGTEDYNFNVAQH